MSDIFSGKNRVFVLSSLVAASLLAVVVVWLIRREHQVTFDSSAWKSASSRDGDTPTVRQQMIDDVAAHVLPGRNRAEIEALLGPSEEARDRTDDNQLIYVLGLERGSFIQIDYEVLFVGFDRSGRFERSAVEPH